MKHAFFGLRSMLAHVLSMCALVAACDAELESNCRDDACGGGLAPGEGGGRTCNQPRGLPTEVCSVLEANCHQCHAGQGPGPFPLLYYCDTQQDYGDKKIYERMKTAVNKTDADPPPKMPADPALFPLDAEELAIMNAWFSTCEAGACELGPGDECGPQGGGGSGVGGAAQGGAGGAGGSGGAGTGGANGGAGGT